MLLTEKEAVEKECPMTQITTMRRQGQCIGIYCMAWRWQHIDTPNYVGPTDKGYCGLAGKPTGENR